MVEPRFIYALGCIWVGQRLYAGVKTLVYSRREDLLGWGKALWQSFSIVLGFQLILKGRAKVLPGVEFLTQPYAARYMHV